MAIGGGGSGMLGGGGALAPMKMFIAAGAATAVAATMLTMATLGSDTTGVIESAQTCGNPSNGASPPGQIYTSNEPSPEALSDIPGNYLDVYKSAGEEYGLDWTYLAAIGKIETDHGRYNAGGACITGPSTPYGSAMGPMQFIGSTWDSVGVDGDGDGVKDPCNYRDAIPAAANYLSQSGAPGDWYGAIFAYNNADWYVNDVMDQADQYRSAAGDGGTEQAAGASRNKDSASEALPPAHFASVANVLRQAGGSRAAKSVVETARSVGTAVGPAVGPREAKAEVLGWDLVGSDQRLTYEDYTAYDSALSHGATEWDALGSVPVESVSSGADVQVGDTTTQESILGRTSTDGTMVFNTAQMDYATQNAQDATASHELGHALGLDHTTNPSVMNTPIIYNSSDNYENPTDFDRQEYYALWGDAQPESTPVDNPDPTGSGGGNDGSVVFPVPESQDRNFTNDFSTSPTGDGHNRVDIVAPEGTDISSMIDGTVIPQAGAQGGDNEILIQANNDVGPIKKGDVLFYMNFGGTSGLKAGDKVQAGQKIGQVGPGSDGSDPFLGVGWFDQSMKRSQSPTGAMNPYPLLEWVVQNGGEGTSEDGTDPVACPDDSGGGPLTLSPDGGSGDGGSGGSGGDGGGGGGGGTGDGAAVIAEAETHLGVPYVLGGPSECVAYQIEDCSCFTGLVYQKFGYSLPDNPGTQMGYGSPVTGEPQAGDLLFWSEHGDGIISHVGIAMGDGSVIHSSSFLGEVGYTDDYNLIPGYVGARRLL